MEMLAAQANHLSGPDLEDEQAIIDDEKLSESEKKSMLQKALNMAASNGDVERLKRLLEGNARPYVDVNSPDEDGTPPLIYASCFVSPLELLGLNASLTNFLGPRDIRSCSYRRRRRREQAGPEPVECPDVGHDKPAQGDSEATTRQRSVIRPEDLVRAYGL